MGEKFIKITEDIIEEIEGDISSFLVDNVYRYYSDSLFGKSYSYQESLIDCESPIEQLLSLALNELDIININSFNPFIDVLAIENQYDIKCENKTYRVDFMIPVLYKNQGTDVNNNEFKTFVIECDGHEFHQKTKKQVEKDNQRTRDLQSVGCEIIRFSGTEIWHKPYQCADEILKIILSKCKYIKDKEV